MTVSGPKPRRAAANGLLQVALWLLITATPQAAPHPQKLQRLRSAIHGDTPHAAHYSSIHNNPAARAPQRPTVSQQSSAPQDRGVAATPYISTTIQHPTAAPQRYSRPRRRMHGSLRRSHRFAAELLDAPRRPTRSSAKRPTQQSSTAASSQSGGLFPPDALSSADLMNYLFLYCPRCKATLRPPRLTAAHPRRSRGYA
jgi:hypothetical protein